MIYIQVMFDMQEMSQYSYYRLKGGYKALLQIR